jgi:hypothetical protein
MKNSNPVSPVILEGDPVELTITNAGVTTAGEYFQSGTLSGSVLTLNINPNTSNFSISSSGNNTKDIVLLRPVSSQETRRLIAKNGCMVTFFGKSIASGAVNIKFESFSDITKASTPVSSYALINNEYITFIFVKDSWRLVSEISPSSVSGNISVTTATATTTTGNAFSGSLTSGRGTNFDVTGSGFGNYVTVNASSTGKGFYSVLNATSSSARAIQAIGAAASTGTLVELSTTGTGTVLSAAAGSETADAIKVTTGNVSVTGSVTSSNIYVTGSYLETLETGDVILTSSSDTNFTLSQVNTKTKVISVRTTTPNASITVTLPSPSDILTASTGAGFYTPLVNTTFYFSVINRSTGTGTITIGTGGADDIGSRVLAVQTSAVFGYRFTNVTTGSVAATLYRMS